MSTERKVDSSDLKPGMYVVRLDRPWLESPFPFQGFWIENWDQVAEVRGVCEYVYIEQHETQTSAAAKPHISTDGLALVDAPSRPKKGLFAGLPDEDETTLSKAFEARLVKELGQREQPAPPATMPLAEELRTARPLIRETRRLVRQQVQDARNGRSLDTPAARECVESITESILRNPDALVCLSALKKRDEYTYMHSLSVCILSIALGRHLGLPRKALRELGLGAFLHDIGKMQIPDAVLNKPGRLNVEEMQIMREHPALGVEIVDGSERIPMNSRNAIYSHHERLDGSGYTQGARQGQIHSLTQIVSVCDTYDAIISHRPYKGARSPLDATAALYQGRGQLFERDLVYQFIGCIGVYPVGSLVELNTGEIGIVSAANADRLRPKVLVVLDEDQQPLEAPQRIDLSHRLQTPAGKRLDIKRSLEIGACGLRPFALLDYMEQHD